MRRALFVIDVQNEYFTGSLPITHPVGHLESILAASDAANARNIPVFVVRHHQPDPKSPIFAKGSNAWELHPAAASMKRHTLIDKSLPGCFTGTGVDAELKSLGVDTVVIAGYMTHMCCDTTARQAMHLGYRVEFLSDATGTLAIDNQAGSVTAEELQRAILCSQQMLISQVLTSEEWAAILD
jgi:nicotinamidase-related amidase